MSLRIAARSTSPLALLFAHIELWSLALSRHALIIQPAYIFICGQPIETFQDRSYMIAGTARVTYFACEMDGRFKRDNDGAWGWKL